MQCLLFYDIPNNRILRWDEDGVTNFRNPSNFSNGHIHGGHGQLVSCENGTWRVTRTDWDEQVTVLADELRRKADEQPQRQDRGPARRRHLGGKILVPERLSNLCFGGRARHRLFITAPTIIYSVILNRRGVQWP